MSDHSLNKFNEQLLLKMTLGQQFKQAFEIPKSLQAYGITQTETAQEILILNQYWMLLQQASKAPKQASEKILQKLAKNAEIISEPSMSDALANALAWVLSKDNPVEYDDWIKHIFLILKAQQRVLQRRLILKTSLYARNVWLFSQILPEIAFTQGVSSSRLDEAKLLYTYLKERDSTALFKSLGKKSRTDWISIVWGVCQYTPEVLQDDPTDFWENLLKSGEVKFYENLLLNTLPPLPKLSSFYQYLLSLKDQSIENIEKNHGLYLYFYSENEQFYPEFISLVHNHLHFDQKKKSLVLSIDLEQQQKFAALKVVPETESQNLKEILSSNLKDKSYDKFFNSSNGGAYIGSILKYLPLKDWKTIFDDWSLLLQLNKYQKEYVYHAFILRCHLEDRSDLILWLCQNDMNWLEKNVHDHYTNQRLYQYLKNDEGKTLIRERLKLHLQENQDVQFWKIWTQIQDDFSDDQQIAAIVLEMLIREKNTISILDDEKIQQLKKRAEVLILNATDLDVEQLKDLFKPTEWQHLSTIVREKRELTSPKF